LTCPGHDVKLTTITATIHIDRENEMESFTTEQHIDELMSLDGLARMEFDIWRMKEVLRIEQEETDNCHPVLAGVMDE
jgi:hypothetical protein